MKRLLLLLLPTLSFSQSTYKGTIINHRTKEKVSFATVGLIPENTGTNANENGEFNLETKVSNPNDTLIISSVGYESLKVPVSQISSIIELEEKLKLLKPVVLDPNEKWNYAKLNYDFVRTINGYTTSGFVTQIAKYFTSPTDYGLLTEVKIFKSKWLFQSSKGIFRIRVYDMDTATMAPAADLCDQVIEVNSDSKVVTVNLEKYKIHPGKYFFVAVEWLKISYNEHRYKATNERTGIKSEYLDYRPFIAVKNFEDRTSIYLPGTSALVWMLTYQNKWMPQPLIEDVGIGAKVRY